MTFLALKQRAAGVEFDNPVLDTMLLPRLLDGKDDDHSLDGLCARYGIDITGRHTAHGDTLATPSCSCGFSTGSRRRGSRASER
jgi:DNA polymerase III subunit epsilon